METIDVSNKYVVSDITTPKNTNALNTVVSLGNRIIKSVDILFAPGHVGITGVRIAYAGVVLLPWNQPAGFIVGDTERLKFDLDFYAPGPVTITTHNSDARYAHRHVITFKLQEVTNPNMNTLPTTIPALVV